MDAKGMALATLCSVTSRARLALSMHPCGSVPWLYICAAQRANQGGVHYLGKHSSQPCRWCLERAALEQTSTPASADGALC